MGSTGLFWAVRKSCRETIFASFFSLPAEYFFAANLLRDGASVEIVAEEGVEMELLSVDEFGVLDCTADCCSFAEEAPALLEINLSATKLKPINNRPAVI